MAAKEKILIIDDETEFAEMLQMRLEARDYTVKVAFDGESGLKKAEDDKPNIILLDVMMPGMDGLAVLRKLRKQDATRHTPVIMLTAKGDTKSIFEAQDSGANEYIIKPCDADRLDALIKKHTGLR